MGWLTRLLGWLHRGQQELADAREALAQTQKLAGQVDAALSDLLALANLASQGDMPTEAQWKATITRASKVKAQLESVMAAWREVGR